MLDRTHTDTPGAARLLGRAVSLIAGAAVVACVWPLTAHAVYTWSEGSTKRFGGTVGNGLVSLKSNGKYAIKLDRVKVWVFGGNAASFDPRTAERLSNGNTLVTDTSGRAVVEYSSSGKVVWRYSSGDNRDLIAPYAAQRLSDRHTLITDYGSGSVIEVDDTDAKKVVWSYNGTTGDAGTLNQPTAAVRLSSERTLIVDSGNHRVIVVAKDGSKKWQYGTTGTSGYKDDQLNQPVQAQRLSNGNTLITDSGNHRVIEVDADGKVKWQFGKSGVKGSDMSHLSSPSSAQRQSDGTTLIADRDNNRLLKVSSTGNAERVDTGIDGVGSLKSPQTVFVTKTGTTLVADQANGRLVEFGAAKSGRYTTDPLDLGTPGVNKQITRIDALANTPDKTAVKIQYSTNGGPWRSVNGSYITFPVGLLATSVRVRADLSTTNRYVTPQLNIVQVAYNVVPKTVGTTGTNTSALYGRPLTFGPYLPGSSSSGAAKTAGAAGALPQGTATPGVAQATVYSGFLMQRVAGSAAATKDTEGLGGLPIEAAGTAAALLLLTTVYSVGLASTTLSHATSGAMSALKAILTRSV